MVHGGPRTLYLRARLMPAPARHPFVVNEVLSHWPGWPTWKRAAGYAISILLPGDKDKLSSIYPYMIIL